MKDVQERRLTEELLDRVEELMRAMQKKDLKAMREVLDRLSFGEVSESSTPEIYAKVQSEKAELLEWEVEDVILRGRMPGRPAGAVVTVTFRIGLPSKAEMKLPGQPLHWVRRLDGKWYATRPPK